ncbi:hypothetical protein GNI_111400 [Gregarina niphandrodes]|uniref:Uncharacterized protein n=1 Tax=Gregarina niphandrodes TaxID=110365 RepID=A0A023B3I7_GRENI|nr:hypothetical protein GNI_111400 [Gregarina niphandrodes]EZG55530.1 hypothetical protein GNI_111400 [Gregarina niphandrodes]|eukprot:XP_011131516.1 hypothetical protein GNI_111400 [Gregarina niphandrodes]
MLGECLEFYSRLLIQEEYLIDDVGRASLWPLVHVRLSKYLRNGGGRDGSLRNGSLIDGLEECVTAKEYTGLSAGEVCTLLTANGRFDWELTTKWFVCVQMLMDSIFMGTPAPEDLESVEDSYSLCRVRVPPDQAQDDAGGWHANGWYAEESTQAWLVPALSLIGRIEVGDLAVVEHLSVLCLDMSLQAVKMWSTCKWIDGMHAAGDLLILVSICVGSFCGHSLPDISDEAASVAEKRLNVILRRVEMNEDVEFAEDIRKGIPLVLYLFNSRDYFELPFLQRLELLMDVGAPRIPMAVSVPSGVLAEVQQFVQSAGLSWQSRYESLVRIQCRVEFFERRRKCFSFEETVEILEILFAWLTEELKTDASWINETRKSCRGRVVEVLVRLLEAANSCIGQRRPSVGDKWEIPLYNMQPQLLLANEDMVVELFGLLCRTWAFEISATSDIYMVSPMKRVDYQVADHNKSHDLVYAAEDYVDLIATLAQTVGSEVMPLARDRRSEMEDLLEQLVVVSYSGISQGLPLFLDDSISQPPRDYTRPGLSRRRKAALSYLEAASSSETLEKLGATVGYAETYRKTNLGFMPHHISDKLTQSLFCLVDRGHVSACRLLSQVKTQANYEILMSAVRYWLELQLTQVSTNLLYNWVALCLKHNPTDLLSEHAHLSERVNTLEHSRCAKIVSHEEKNSSPSSWSSVTGPSVTGSGSKSITPTAKEAMVKEAMVKEAMVKEAMAKEAMAKGDMSIIEEDISVTRSDSAKAKWFATPEEKGHPRRLESKGVKGRLALPVVLLQDICASLDCVKLAIDLNPEFDMLSPWNEFRQILIKVISQIDAIHELCPGAGLLTPALRAVLTSSVDLMRNPQLPFHRCLGVDAPDVVGGQESEDDYEEDLSRQEKSGNNENYPDQNFQDVDCRHVDCQDERYQGGRADGSGDEKWNAAVGIERSVKVRSGTEELDMLEAMVKGLVDPDFEHEEEDGDESGDVSPAVQSILDFVDCDHSDPYAVRPNRRGRLLGSGLHEDLLQYVKGYFWDDRLEGD